MASYDPKMLYDALLNNLQNQGQMAEPEKDANGNYILNKGTKSEKIISPAEWQSIKTERQANRLQAAQQMQQNPEPYNPRAEWLRMSTQNSMNRTTPLTVEDFLKQMGGLNSMGVTAEQLQQRFNEKPLENTSNPSMLGQKLTDEDIKQMYANWKPYGSESFQSDPALEAKVAGLNIPARQNQTSTMPSTQTPQADFDDAGGKQAGTPPTTYSQTAPTASEFGASKVYKPTNYAAQTLEKLKSNPAFKGISNLQNYLTDVIQNPGSNKLTPEAQAAVEEYKAAIEKDKSALKDGMIYEQDGKLYVWDEKAGGWLGEQDIDKQTTPEAYQTVQTYNEIYKPYYNANKTTDDAGGKPPVKPTGVAAANDPNNLPYNNPESNKPILPTSYTGQISLPTDPYEMQLMDYLKKQFEDKTWENKYNELQKQYQDLANRPDKYSGMIEKAGGEDVAGYIKSLYEGSADPLRREAQRMQEQNQADLAARGLGMSTIVNDVNSGVQRELMGNLGDLSNKANVQGRDMYLNALKSAADVYGQHGAQQGNVLNAMSSNIGNQLGAQQIGLANINDILAKQEARRLTNMQTGINQWDKDVANYWKYQYYPIDAYAGQNTTAGQAAQVGTNQYNQAVQNAATQNQTAGYVGATIAANMAKQPQNFTYQPISGGLAGAQQGAQAGFNTKPKPGAYNQ